MWATQSGLLRETIESRASEVNVLLQPVTHPCDVHLEITQGSKIGYVTLFRQSSECILYTYIKVLVSAARQDWATDDCKLRQVEVKFFAER